VPDFSNVAITGQTVMLSELVGVLQLCPTVAGVCITSGDGDKIRDEASIS